MIIPCAPEKAFGAEFDYGEHVCVIPPATGDYCAKGGLSSFDAGLRHLAFSMQIGFLFLPRQIKVM